VSPPTTRTSSTGRPRHAVGLDLGTTNSALATLPLGEAGARPEVLGIPQVVQPGQVEPRPLLPSFLYLSHPAEFAAGALRLPWDEARDYLVGELARSHGGLAPVRLVSSAKSWLCHPGIDRRQPALPVGSPAEVPRVSPLEASARTLQHLREAFDFSLGRGEPSRGLARQELVLTVPASFDAVARELTVEAAALADLDRVTLLEEPQAALYAWVEGQGDAWRQQVRVGELILVCDVGGGTTDFCLIAVVDRDGELGLERVAVGDHILLGGDNMDLALAHLLQQKLAQAGKKLDPWQLLTLIHGARVAKERLFAEPTRESLPVTVPGRGSRLIGGTLKTELTQAELAQTLLEGFFPACAATEAPFTSRRSGLTQLGLPYAQDPAVTRHLAAFLRRQRQALQGEAGRAGVLAQVRLEGRELLHPTAVLFNGGVMRAPQLEARVLSVLQGWIAAAGGTPPRKLPAADLDTAVALGGACYGRVRQGQGIRIRGGTARAYYIGIEKALPAVPGLAPPLQAVCLAPMGMEEGTSTTLPALEVGVVVGEPAEFRLFASSVRRADVAGDLGDAPELELTELPSLETTLPPAGRPAGAVVPVQLQADVTELGTLQLGCREAGGEVWKLEFNLRKVEAPEPVG